MRRPPIPLEITRSVVRDLERLAIRPAVRWHHRSGPSAFGAETAGLLPRLVEALAPLGMPEVGYDSRRYYGSWVRRLCAAMHLPGSCMRPSVINVAVVVVIHLAAIRYVFLPIGMV